MINLKDSFVYPFIKFRRLFFFFLAFIPFLGTISYIGYLYKVTLFIIQEKDRETPNFGNFWENFINGLKLIIFLLILSILIYFIIYYFEFYVLIIVPFLPLMIIQFITTGSAFKGLNIFMSIYIIFTNFLEFLVTLLKFILITIFYIILSVPIIPLLITFPSWLLSSNYLWSQFYKYAKIWELNKATEEKVLSMIADDKLAGKEEINDAIEKVKKKAI